MSSKLSRSFHLFLVILLVSLLVGGAMFTEPQGKALYASAPTGATGAIAYIHDGAIRVIDADGTDDRLLWQVPNPAEHTISAVDWSPDGSRLAFASDHESTCSLFRSDIYSIRADGTDLRRLTNSPGCTARDGLPNGSVQITIKNNLTESLYLLYVEGAPSAIELLISPGTTRTVTVDHVADFGDGMLQRVVVFQTEANSWLTPSVTVDVKPNTTTAASDIFVISNNTAARYFGAYSPSWRHDGQAVAFALGNVGGYQIAANPAIAQADVALFPDGSLFFSKLAMSPLDERVLIYSFPRIGLGTIGDTASVTAIVQLDGAFGGMDWLHDGRGMVGSEALGLGNTYANLWTYTFSTGEIANLTHYDDENRGLAFDPSVSPDGAAIVFSHAPTGDTAAELQIMAIDGSNIRSLGVRGIGADWGTQNQSSQPTPTPSPTATSRPQPTPTPIATLDPATVSNLLYLPVVQH